VSRNKWDISVIDLGSFQETVIAKTSADDAELYPTIHAISGPDLNGRIAYIEDHFFDKPENERKHLLKSINVDGTGDTEIFSRPGDAMWAAKGEIGRHIALSPVGGKVAFITNVIGRQMPRAYLHEGRIEIWDLEKKVGHITTVRGLDEPICWFPDGKRLLYTRLTSRSTLPMNAIGLELFGTYYGDSWSDVPAIYTLDIENEKSTFLHVGWIPVISFDQEIFLVGGYDNRSDFSWNRFDPTTGVSQPTKWH
jgi:hypothetical protein